MTGNSDRGDKAQIICRRTTGATYPTTRARGSAVIRRVSRPAIQHHHRHSIDFITTRPHYPPSRQSLYNITYRFCSNILQSTLTSWVSSANISTTLLQHRPPAQASSRHRTLSHPHHTFNTTAQWTWTPKPHHEPTAGTSHAPTA